MQLMSQDILGIFWGYFGDIFGIFWRYFGDILGIFWGYFGRSPQGPLLRPAYAALHCVRRQTGICHPAPCSISSGSMLMPALSPYPRIHTSHAIEIHTAALLCLLRWFEYNCTRNKKIKQGQVSLLMEKYSPLIYVDYDAGLCDGITYFW